MYRVHFKSIDINTRSLENSDAIYSRELFAHIVFSERSSPKYFLTKRLQLIWLVLEIII